MITFKTVTQVKGLTSSRFCEFMINCNDTDYQRWWPETHLQFHTIIRYPGEIGNIVYFDEYIGTTRLQTKAVVKRYEPGRLIEWQMKRFILLPVKILISVQMLPVGLEIQHVVSIGFDGILSILDPLFRILIPKNLENNLDGHVRTEFCKLTSLLNK